MMRLTRAADYAIRVMMVLAELPPGKVCSKSELAKSQLVPGSFLSKILQQLVAGELIVSHRGVHGGFALNKTASDISVLDIMTAVEGPLEINYCVIPEKKGCDRVDNCPGMRVWVKVQAELTKLLSGVSLRSMIKDQAGRPVEPCK